MELCEERIDQIIENVFPRSLELSDLVDTVGLGKTGHIDTKALNQALTGPIWEMLDRGGKRWRPKLFALTVEACGGDLRKVEDFLAFPELLHTGSLIIDDIEDAAVRRRGQEALHRQYGIDVAINAGNFLYFLPLKIFLDHQNDFRPKIVLRAYSVYFRETVKMHMGQGIDIQWDKMTGTNMTEGHYLKMCALKTGGLARLTTRLAAILSGASIEEERDFSLLGERIGRIYQIKDDIVDLEQLEGEQSKLSNSCKKDLRQSKKTVIVLHALNNSSLEDRRRLKHILSEDEPTKYQLRQALKIIRKCGSIAYAKKLADREFQKIIEITNNIISSAPMRAQFETFLSDLLNRNN